jgi:uncharacterized protein
VNRLARETSPYLRQHADNPVDWYPWGPEALERARQEDRPVLLSIGYSSCHWCHVMERESFSDPETARLMNERYVSVKVDREERPDVDGIYMRAVQAMTGRGGWPLTAFLTPEGVPFYGGTYFPPEPRHGMPSFRQLLEAVGSAWDGRRDEILESAERIRELLAHGTVGPGGGEPAAGKRPGAGVDRRLLENATGALLGQFDPTHGGFGSAPKFPQPVVLQFLLEAGTPEEGGTRPGGETGPEPRGGPGAALLTLRKMAAGGIRDHLAGGFHRYSVDARWLVPHFEKMLYDNALLARAYLEGWRITGDEALADEVRTTLDWMLAEMQAPEGGFYSALDADTEGEEGRFYVWSAPEVDEVLGEGAPLFREVHGITAEGNWEGTNILHLPGSLEAAARRHDLTPEELRERMASARRALLTRREGRERPFRDTKVLASWNGFALRALAEAGAALPEPRYVEAAVRSLHRLLQVLPDEDGRLRHQVTEGVAAIPAFLDDVAALGNAALSLHEATLDPRWLAAAVELAEEMEARFRDPETGLLMDTPEDGEPLIVRPRDVMDSAIPSGTALAAELLLRLGRLLGREEWIRETRAMVDREARGLEAAPGAFGRLLAVAGQLESPPVEVAVTGDPADHRTRQLLERIHRLAPAGRVLTGGDPEAVAAALPFPVILLEGRAPVEGVPAAWVCRNHTCRTPITDPADLGSALGSDG